MNSMARHISDPKNRENANVVGQSLPNGFMDGRTAANLFRDHSADSAVADAIDCEISKLRQEEDGSIISQVDGVLGW